MPGLDPKEQQRLWIDALISALNGVVIRGDSDSREAAEAAAILADCALEEWRKRWERSDDPGDGWS